MSKFEDYLAKPIQDFIAEHYHSSIEALVLKKQIFDKISNQALAQQIKAKQKARLKLPNLFKRRDIVYPQDLNLQQTSSELTAQYKTKFINKIYKIADLTGGFGIDSMAFAKKADKVYHIEQNTDLSELATFNFKQLKISNISTINTTDVAFLKNIKFKLDLLYIDPSRRDKKLHKVFMLEDCSPNVLENMELYAEKSRQVLLKLSPLFDLKKIISDLKHVKQIDVLSIKNEVKELLVLVDFKFNGEPKIICVDLLNETKAAIFEFNFKKELNIETRLSQPEIGQILIEPMGSILKAGGFKSLADDYHLKKLHVNTHLYTSNKALNEAIGRQFNIIRIEAYKPKSLKKLYKNKKANVSSRNFPLSVDEIKKKIGIYDGGETYLFFTTNYKNQRIVIEANKL
ncbi:THUMP-like domain-containing protein [Psychroflexus sp. ALD_RP9]|uniref:THUMP-like domain-containing protein n=1 Tax=Psychroflexus sp. ALD_RP9 TaxID=2777186 RepID=UPI001A8F3C8B|nr:class I SAM-dependent methyltransferase [Psychroflexus sp. ALD_RP9]QSS97317.1 class I SAM-dependent methyltransferase [Psychroflexus sp. ALD_RP9]